MSTRFTKSFVGTTFAAGAIALAALFTAGTASASATDTAFLAQLAKDGIQPPSDQAAITLAHSVCTSLDQGATGDEVIQAVQKETKMSAKGSKTFAVDAASAYCPQYVKSS